MKNLFEKKDTNLLCKCGNTLEIPAISNEEIKHKANKLINKQKLSKNKRIRKKQLKNTKS